MQCLAPLELKILDLFVLKKEGYPLEYNAWDASIPMYRDSFLIEYVYTRLSEGGG